MSAVYVQPAKSSSVGTVVGTLTVTAPRRNKINYYVASRIEWERDGVYCSFFGGSCPLLLVFVVVSVLMLSGLLFSLGLIVHFLSG